MQIDQVLDMPGREPQRRRPACRRSQANRPASAEAPKIVEPHRRRVRPYGDVPWWRDLPQPREAAQTARDVPPWRGPTFRMSSRIDGRSAPDATRAAWPVSRSKRSFDSARIRSRPVAGPARGVQGRGDPPRGCEFSWSPRIPARRAPPPHGWRRQSGTRIVWLGEAGAGRRRRWRSGRQGPELADDLRSDQ